ncbi:hypothetical protein AX17_006520 [Amanita inopinata Kibby_2008]|nr:hypothetical protein AX17_006520 [Amanita inopinata Kibby_2008]
MVGTKTSIVLAALAFNAASLAAPTAYKSKAPAQVEASQTDLDVRDFDEELYAREYFDELEARDRLHSHHRALAQAADPDLYGREFDDDELYARELYEEELEARSFDDVELDARFFDDGDELEARSFDGSELEARFFDDHELEARALDQPPTTPNLQGNMANEGTQYPADPTGSQIQNESERPSSQQGHQDPHHQDPHHRHPQTQAGNERPHHRHHHHRKTRPEGFGADGYNGQHSHHHKQGSHSPALPTGQQQYQVNEQPGAGQAPGELAQVQSQGALGAGQANGPLRRRAKVAGINDPDTTHEESGLEMPLGHEDGLTSQSLKQQTKPHRRHRHHHPAQGANASPEKESLRAETAPIARSLGLEEDFFVKRLFADSNDF